MGDIYDTSPYDPRAVPEIEPYVASERPLGIVSTQFVQNLGRLIAFVAPVA